MIMPLLLVLLQEEKYKNEMKALCAAPKQPALPPGTMMKALPAPKSKAFKHVSLISVSFSMKLYK